MWFQSEALTLNCTFSESTVWKIKGYFCNANITSLGDNYDVLLVSTNHTLGKNNRDVKGLYVKNETLKSMPSKLSESFPNLEAINIDSSGLTKIKRDDL